MPSDTNIPLQATYSHDWFIRRCRACTQKAWRCLNRVPRDRERTGRPAVPYELSKHWIPRIRVRCKVTLSEAMAQLPLRTPNSFLYGIQNYNNSLRHSSFAMPCPRPSERRRSDELSKPHQRNDVQAMGLRQQQRRPNRRGPDRCKRCNAVTGSHRCSCTYQDLATAQRTPVWHHNEAGDDGSLDGGSSARKWRRAMTWRM